MCAVRRRLYVRPEAVCPNDRHHENIRLVVVVVLVVVVSVVAVVVVVVIVVSPPSLQVPQIEVISSARVRSCIHKE